MHSHSPFVYFPVLVDYRCVRSEKENEILTSSKGALNSKHLEALEDHQGSLYPFIAQCFSLPLAPPPAPLPLPFLLDVISESSLRLPDNPDAHTPTTASFRRRLILILLSPAAFTSTRSRTSQGHVEIFQTEMLPRILAPLFQV